MPILIPYAADAVAAHQIAASGEFRLPTVAVKRGDALRLNSGQLVFGEPPPVATLTDVDSQLDFLCGHVRHQCGLWSKYARRFVERYFAFVRAEIAAAQPELSAILAPFGDLYAVEHWAFSALRPLPRAHLAAPAPGAEAPPDCFVRAEIAFWTESGPVAIELAGNTTLTERDRQRRARLDAAGIAVVVIPHAVLDNGGIAGLAAHLPDSFHAFWRGETLPSGPFGADITPDRLPETTG